MLRAAAVLAEDREGVTLLRVVRPLEDALAADPLPEELERTLLPLEEELERTVLPLEAELERTLLPLEEELERTGLPPMLKEEPDARGVEEERTLPEELDRTLLPLDAELERTLLPEELLEAEPDRTGDCEDTAGELERVLLLTERLALPEL